jgi:hypothetical protein
MYDVRSSLPGILALLSLLAACDDAGAPVDCKPDAGPVALDGAIARFSFRCSLYYRQSNEAGPSDSDDDPKLHFSETIVALSPGEQKSADFGALTFRASASADQFEGGALNLLVVAGDKMVASWLYQFAPDKPPENQFATHGFTGLVYLTHPQSGGDYQLFCHTVQGTPKPSD